MILLCVVARVFRNCRSRRRPALEKILPKILPGPSKFDTVALVELVEKYEYIVVVLSRGKSVSHEEDEIGGGASERLSASLSAVGHGHVLCSDTLSTPSSLFV